MTLNPLLPRIYRAFETKIIFLRSLRAEITFFSFCRHCREGGAQWTSRLQKLVFAISAPKPPGNLILVSNVRQTCGKRGLKVILLNSWFTLLNNWIRTYWSKVKSNLKVWDLEFSWTIDSLDKYLTTRYTLINYINCKKNSHLEFMLPEWPFWFIVPPPPLSTS